MTMVHWQSLRTSNIWNTSTATAIGTPPHPRRGCAPCPSQRPPDAPQRRGTFTVPSGHWKSLYTKGGDSIAMLDYRIFPEGSPNHMIRCWKNFEIWQSNMACSPRHLKDFPIKSGNFSQRWTSSSTNLIRHTQLCVTSRLAVVVISLVSPHWKASINGAQCHVSRRVPWDIKATDQGSSPPKKKQDFQAVVWLCVYVDTHYLTRMHRKMVSIF